MADEQQTPEPRVVAAVGTSTRSLHPGLRDRARLMQAAEVRAIEDCMAAGISVHDTDAILDAKRRYREAVKGGWDPTTPAEKPETE